MVANVENTFRERLDKATLVHQMDYLIGIENHEYVNPHPTEVAPLLQAGFIRLERVETGNIPNYARPLGTWYVYSVTERGRQLSFELEFDLQERTRFENR